LTNISRQVKLADKKSADFCMMHDRENSPILSTLNSTAELGSNFTEKIGQPFFG